MELEVAHKEAAGLGAKQRTDQSCLTGSCVSTRGLVWVCLQQLNQQDAKKISNSAPKCEAEEFLLVATISVAGFD